jgi:hypothetical protein
MWILAGIEFGFGAIDASGPERFLILNPDPLTHLSPDPIRILIRTHAD